MKGRGISFFNEGKGNVKKMKKVLWKASFRAFWITLPRLEKCRILPIHFYTLKREQWGKTMATFITSAWHERNVAILFLFFWNGLKKARAAQFDAVVASLLTKTSAVSENQGWTVGCPLLKNSLQMCIAQRSYRCCWMLGETVVPFPSKQSGAKS